MRRPRPPALRILVALSLLLWLTLGGCGAECVPAPPGESGSTDAGEGHLEVGATDSGLPEGPKDRQLPGEPKTDSGPGEDGGLADGGGEKAADPGPTEGPADQPPEEEPPEAPTEPQPEPPPETGQPELPPECPPRKPFDYRCVMGKPATCPGGICLAGLCIGPKLDPKRWDSCGDGKCEKCETPVSCPADCGKAPQTTGKKEYDNKSTITVWVHGFAHKGAQRLKTMKYGEARSCSGILDAIGRYGTKRPCGNTAAGEKAPNHMVGVEYYGARPAAWMGLTDRAGVEKYPYDGGPQGLQRYAEVVARFIRHRLKISGATHVNLACHSMGCLILRHVIENDLQGLASSNRLVRWFSSAGVIAGARLARLFDNPSAQQVAGLIGLSVDDFIFMNPDYVRDHTAAWDHKLYAANNPLFGGMLIHHAAATDPRIKEALNIKLLDLNNPGNEPNDGIMFTEDEFLHSTGPKASFKAKSGEVLQPSRSFHHIDHMNLPKTEAAGVLATAGLFHRRKVIVRMTELELIKDREKHSILDKENGLPPAEVAVEVQVRYDPYVKKTFGKDVLIHNHTLAQRTPSVWQQKQGQTLTTKRLLFSGPILDGMKELRLSLKVLEVDWYPRGKVAEWAFDAHQSLIDYTGQVALKNGSFEIKSQYARARIEVRVVTLY